MIKDFQTGVVTVHLQKTIPRGAPSAQRGLRTSRKPYSQRSEAEPANKSLESPRDILEGCGSDPLSTVHHSHIRVTQESGLTLDLPVISL